MNLVLEAAAFAVGQWVRGSLARLPDGTRTYVSDDEACSFCALGLVDRASMELYPDDQLIAEIERIKARGILANTLSPSVEGFNWLGQITAWNDQPGRTADEVAELLLKAAHVGSTG